MENNEVKIFGTILLKRGLKDDLIAAFNGEPEVLKPGEPAYEIDTKNIRIGDGLSAYENLPYVGGLTEIENFLKSIDNGTDAIDTLAEILNKFEIVEGKIDSLPAAQLRSDLDTEIATRISEDKVINSNLNSVSDRVTNLEEINITAKITDINNRIASTNGALSDEVLRATKAEDKVLSDAKTYIDKVKTDILGEGITETFDTLVEIQDWINGDGINATELTKAIADEAKLRVDEDTAIRKEYKDADVALEESLKNYFDTELGVIANGSY